MPTAYPPDAQLPLRRLPLPEALAALPEAIVEAGQDLRDRRAPQLRNAGAGLWVLATAPDRGQPPAETELLLTGRKVKSYTCTCAAFAKTRECMHVAAVLALAQLSKRPKAITRAPAGPKSVTTETLLSRVPEGELRDFLLRRARRDADLGLALRTAFAHHTNLRDRFGPVLARVLDRRGRAYSPKELRRVGETLTHFARLREGWRAESAWVDLLEACTALADRIIVVLDRLEGRRLTGVPEGARAYLAAVLDDLAAIARAPAAPALLERLGTWVEEQLGRGAYYRQDLDAALLTLAADLPGGSGEALASARSAIERFGESPPRVRAYWGLLDGAGETEQATALAFAHADDPALVLAVLGVYVQRERYARAAELCRAALARIGDGPDRERLMRFYAALGAENRGVPPDATSVTKDPL